MNGLLAKSLGSATLESAAFLDVLTAQQSFTISWLGRNLSGDVGTLQISSGSASIIIAYDTLASFALTVTRMTKSS